MENRLTKEEQALFDSLSKQELPPADLEDKIVDQLKKQKLISSQSAIRMLPNRFWASGIAAAIGIFIFGYLLGNESSGESADISAGYILLLHEDERFQPVGSEMEVFTEYATWMGKMFLKGVNITGKELSPESTYWLSSEGFTLTENRKDKISGYFIIDIEDQDEAERIARSSPHIKYGGTVELIKLSERN